MEKQWLVNIFEILYKLSDIRTQKDIWLGKSIKVSSYTELMCSLYDDNQFEDFISNEFWNNKHNTLKLKTALVELNEMINSFILIPIGTDKEIIENPKWNMIVIKAKEVVDLWITSL